MAAAARSAGCAFTSWRTAPHFDSLAEQTTLIAAMEARRPWGQFAAARDLLICGPADKFAADVRETAEQWPVDAIRVVTSAPHRAILPESAIVITHAGHGTVLKALAAGVPLVCVPMGRDQADNTVRVLRLGAGVRVGKTAGPRQFAAAVRRVLDQPRYVQAARSFAATLAREAETQPTAIDEAETLLTLGRSRRHGG